MTHPLDLSVSFFSVVQGKLRTIFLLEWKEPGKKNNMLL